MKSKLFISIFVLIITFTVFIIYKASDTSVKITSGPSEAAIDDSRIVIGRCPRIVSGISKNNSNNDSKVITDLQIFLFSDELRTYYDLVSAYPTPRMGIFDEVTENALKELQLVMGLEPSGKIDSKTVEQMYSLCSIIGFN